MSWVALMYHDVLPEVPDDGAGPGRFTVSRDSFESMLDRILAAGARGCSLDDAMQNPHDRNIAITFDDGTEGQFRHAVPALREREMTATFFVVTDWVGKGGFMSWDQLRQLTSWGMSVGSHSRSHPHLSELSAAELRDELLESRVILDAHLGQETTQIALPGGNAPRRSLRSLLGDCGYRAVATSRWGINPAVHQGGEPRWIKRCNVPRRLSSELADRIVAGDPWLVAARAPREALLNGLRGIMGADRYARWRRRVLDRVT